MADTKHTPGPWRAVTPKESRFADTAAVICMRRGKRVQIAETWDIDGTLPINERITNARLIAAAPDLAETNAASIDVMERAADQLEHAGRKEIAEQLRRQANICRAALAKATGAT